ncbi:MAG: hypothetical protein VB055_06980 [Oscillospiraceae bacterium]|nr:hypothetical protein [Oscillospiraceae bacterium]
MSTSDRKALQRRAMTALWITVFCGFFSGVYEHFSHGVESPYMVYLFLFPLLLGFLPYLLLSVLPRARRPGPLPAALYRAGVATLTVGCCLRGVFEIYGTTVPLVRVYWPVGAALAVAGVLFYLRPRPAIR